MGYKFINQIGNIFNFGSYCWAKDYFFFFLPIKRHFIQINRDGLDVHLRMEKC